MAYWLGRYAPALAQDRGLAVAIGGYFGWLTLFDLFYAYAGSHPRRRPLGLGGRLGGSADVRPREPPAGQVAAVAE